MESVLFCSYGKRQDVGTGANLYRKSKDEVTRKILNRYKTNEEKEGGFRYEDDFYLQRENQAL